jgi:hypothetical protein
MSDTDRLLRDEDKLPWLEPVENDERPRGGGTGAVVAALVAALVALGLVVGGVFWLRDNGPAGLSGGQSEMIAAPAGPYKQKPTEPGGMKVEGQGDAAFTASTGAEVNAAIDIDGVAEAPLSGKGSAPAEVAAAPVAKTPVPTVKVAAAAAPSAPAAAARFAYLKPLTSSVTPVKSGSSTLYRLRASAGPDAAIVCGKLKVAGETCAVL